MEYRYLGDSGLQVSALSFGAWVTFGNQVDEDAAARMMQTAFDAGVNFFDNAEVYAAGRAEAIMGAVLKKAGWKRPDYLVSTKIFWGGDGPNERGLSRKHIVEGTDAALGRLGIDYVDLIFCHRADLHTPVEETVRAMNHIIDQGKALYWGTSEWPAERILEAWHVARRERLIPPLMEQPQYHMFHRDRFEREYAPLYERTGLGTTIWSPLAGGLLTGKYRDGIPEGSRSTLEGFGWLHDRYGSEAAQQNIEKVERLRPVAEELGATLPQLAIAWCLKNPHVTTAILGASRPQQLEENLGALDVAERLTDEVMERIEEILDNRPEPEPDWR
jgi:voltage-dependent potassium channel beta subunit